MGEEAQWITLPNLNPNQRSPIRQSLILSGRAAKKSKQGKSRSGHKKWHGKE
jgi:hypothetical protein